VADEAPHAAQVMLVGDEVVIVWRDGHESYFKGETLRKACTCAACKGEQHLFGRRTLPVLKPIAAGAFQPAAIRLVGNYGLQVTWGDGHEHGIYHLADLRAACPCEECLENHASGAAAPEA
jgi:DUF971 family protein